MGIERDDAEALRALADRIAARVDGRRIATAESCTAGLIVRTLSEAEGASDWLLGSVVSYHRDVKYDVLDVPHGPVVNHTAAQAMVRGVVRLLGADAAVAITGAAGPTGQDGAEPGTVFVGFSIDGIEDTVEFRFDGSRDDVMVQAAKSALAGLLERLGDNDAAQPSDPAAVASMRSTSPSST